MPDFPHLASLSLALFTLQTYPPEHVTGCFPSESSSCFPRSVQIQIFRATCPHSSAKPPCSPGRGQAGAAMAPSPSCQAQAPRVDWVHPGCWASLEKHQEYIPPPVPEPWPWACLSSVALLVFSYSLGKRGWPSPRSWHTLSPNARPTSHQVMGDHSRWKEAVWAFCALELLHINAARENVGQQPFWLTAHAIENSTSQKILANGLLPISF